MNTDFLGSADRRPAGFGGMPKRRSQRLAIDFDLRRRFIKKSFGVERRVQSGGSYHIG